MRTCHENGCGLRAVWNVSTAAGWVPFCDVHVQWYRDKGPDIYPVEPIAAVPAPAPAPETDLG